MEKNEVTLTRIVLKDLIGQLEEAIYSMDDDETYHLLEEINKEYQYYKSVNEDGE